MKRIALMLCLCVDGVAGATEATRPAADRGQDIHAVGRLNVNRATRDQLLKVPGLDAAAADLILRARPIEDLEEVGALPEVALEHLKTDGDSNFYRIVQQPLVVLDATDRASR